MSGVVTSVLAGRRAGALTARGLLVLCCLLWHPMAAAAVSGSYIYWANTDSNTIGRANLDGTGVNQNFIMGVNDPNEVAVDGQHLYWINSGSGAIGRANLDGSGVIQRFISTPSNAAPSGLAVDAQHVYWANDGQITSGAGTIGRANLDGKGVNQSFIVADSIPTGVTANGQYVYWTNYDSGSIGIANLDGTGVNNFFIMGAFTPSGVAVDGQHIYWANPGSGAIGIANLNGTGVDQNFITGADNPHGVAVSVAPQLTAPVPLPELRLAIAGPHAVTAGHFTNYRITLRRTQPRNQRVYPVRNVQVIGEHAGGLLGRFLVSTLASGRTRMLQLRVRIPGSAHGSFCITATATANNTRGAVARDCARVAG